MYKNYTIYTLYYSVYVHTVKLYKVVPRHVVHTMYPEHTMSVYRTIRLHRTIHNIQIELVGGKSNKLSTTKK